MDDVFEVAPQTGEDYHTPGTTPPDTAMDPFSDAEGWNLNMDAKGSFSFYRGSG